MSRRSGASLIEVLVAIFVMAIGMLALLTLFPIGALRMAQALQDERCALAGGNATDIDILHNLRNDKLATRMQTVNGLKDPYLDNQGGIADLTGSPGPSHPVFIDPIGYQGSPLGPAQDWVGAVTGALRRRPVSLGQTTVVNGQVVDVPLTGASLFSWFTLWDDVTYNTDPFTGALPIPGTAALTGNTSGSVMRDTRYSWAYLCQRPRATDPTVTNCQVVVFNRRPLTLTPGLTLSEFVFGNTAFNANNNVAFDVNNNTITINNDTTKPAVTAGDWILDATPHRKVFMRTGPNAADVSEVYVPHGYFYRIVGVTELSPTSTQLEVAGPLRGWRWPNPNLAGGNQDVMTNSPETQGSGVFLGIAVVMDGVAEVYERGSVRLP